MPHSYLLKLGSVIMMNAKLKNILKIIIPHVFMHLIYRYRDRRLPFLENVFDKSYNLNCLIVYITHPFIKGINNSHQNSWQVVELAKIVNEFGYNVDVIDYNYVKSNFDKKYDMLIDLHPRDNVVYNKFLKENCIKIAYLTGSNPSFSNIAEEDRINNVYKRHGQKLLCRRYAELISKRIETYDAAFFIGNKYNLRTYTEFKMPPVYFIKNTGYDFKFSNKNRKANNFMFLASLGQVHKGLDLLLDIFANTCKDCNLYICSNFKEELDFCDLYKNELYNTPNIIPIGFLDINSEEFKNISEKCAYMIMPSCSEANAGSVLTAMSAGMIPIVSRECGFEDDEVIHLDDCSLACIEKFIKFYSVEDEKSIKDESDKAVKIVKERYSNDNFRKSIRNGLMGVLDERSKNAL